MATPIVMPRQGNTVESCVLIEWKKKKGDRVTPNDIICEVETDKAVFEIESPADGFLLDVFFDEGDEIPVLTNIAVVGKQNENYDDLTPQKMESQEPEIEMVKDIPAPGEKIIGMVRQNLPYSKTGISPRAKKLADKLGVSLEDIYGTGPEGRIIERDILVNAQQREPVTPAARDALTKGGIIPEQGTGLGNRITLSDIRSAKRDESTVFPTGKTKEVPLKGIRKLIAERMLYSTQNSAQLTLNRTAEATAFLSLRKKFKNSKKYRQFNQVTINDMILYAVTRVISDHPGLNSLLINDTIVYAEGLHLGFAVDTPRGLMVPVIRNAQNFNLLSISEETKRLSSACLEKKIQPEELNGGTFTVTNLGIFGIETFSPVLNLPQTAILGVGNINLKPVALEEEIKFTPHISLSLTIDHQVIDGVTGARFLQDLALTISEIERIADM